MEQKESRSNSLSEANSSEKKTTGNHEAHQGTIKMLLELGPLVIFFATYYLSDFFTATLVFMGAFLISIFISWIKLRKLSFMLMVNGAVVLIFGSLTIFLQDETFFKMKPTIVSCLFAIILLVGQMMGRSPLKLLFAGNLNLSDIGWRILTYRWAIFFLFLACINELIWRNFSEAFWVNFKVWGILPLTLIFSGLQIYLVREHMEGEQPK